MSKLKLNTLNFRPSRGSEAGKLWSVIFLYGTSYRERRFDTELEADTFAAQFPERTTEKSRSPLFINVTTGEQHI